MESDLKDDAAAATLITVPDAAAACFRSAVDVSSRVHGELSEGAAAIGAPGKVVQCGQGPNAIGLTKLKSRSLRVSSIQVGDAIQISGGIHQQRCSRTRAVLI